MKINTINQLSSIPPIQLKKVYFSSFLSHNIDTSNSHITTDFLPKNCKNEIFINNVMENHIGRRKEIYSSFFTKSLFQHFNCENESIFVHSDEDKKDCVYFKISNDCYFEVDIKKNTLVCVINFKF